MNTLTSRELSHIQDHLTQEALMVKKFKFTAEQTTDPQLRKLYEHTAQTHEKHFKLLWQHLNDPSIAATQTNATKAQNIQ